MYELIYTASKISILGLPLVNLLEFFLKYDFLKFENLINDDCSVKIRVKVSFDSLFLFNFSFKVFIFIVVVSAEHVWENEKITFSFFFSTRTLCIFCWYTSTVFFYFKVEFEILSL